MEMIIGGAYQGKSSYAKKQFPDVKWKCGAELTEEELLEAEGVLGFHQYIRKCLEAGANLSGLTEKLAEKNPGVVLVSEEVAGKSSKVTRVVCGIGMVLKND